jgi:hypothetical protein
MVLGVMSDKYRIVAEIGKMSAAQNGVFSLSDLRNLLQIRSRDSFYRVVKGLCTAGVILRFSRGFYVTEGFYPAVLSQRICPESYISFGSVLADNLLIGSVPKYRIRAVKPKPTRVYKNDECCVEHLGIKPELSFGWMVDKGIKRAEPEKAVLDTLYFYRLGTKFSFDIYSDIDYNNLNKEKINEYLAKYKNPVFVNFVRSLINV